MLPYRFVLGDSIGSRGRGTSLAVSELALTRMDLPFRELSFTNAFTGRGRQTEYDT